MSCWRVHVFTNHSRHRYLIDEIAFTKGELMLVMINHTGGHENELISEALANAKRLRECLRVGVSQGHQVTKECASFWQGVTQLVIDSERAA